MKKGLFIFVIIGILVFLPFYFSQADTVRFKTIQYTDAQGIGLEAFRMLVPSNWLFEGGIQWTLENPAMPAVASFRVYNPKGTEELQIFPNQMFYWTTSQMQLQLFPIGTQYFGSEVHPVLSATEFLRRILVPRVRGQMAGLKIMEVKPLPELAKMVGAGMEAQPGVSTWAEGGKISIQYSYGGRRYEEEIYAVVEGFTYPLQTLQGPMPTTNWLGDYIFSFKAEQGRLKASTKIFETMVTSFQLNQAWFNKYSQVVEYLIQQQIRRIQNIGQLSRIISQTSSEISESRMRDWEQRQAVYDRLSTDFCQHIRGVDEYYDPVKGQPVELPSGYTSGWTNGLGEYVLTDSPSYNPNVGSNKNWQPMTRRD